MKVERIWIESEVVIQNGEVNVNGETCTMRGKKMRAGDCAEYEDTKIEVEQKSEG